MAFDRTKLSAKTNPGVFTIFTYSSDDAKATINDGGYFVEEYNKVVNSGDIIIYASDMDTDTPDMGVWLIHNI